LRAFLRRLGGSADSPAAEPAPAQLPGAVDMVDQAEAFQTLRVADVMTPRADITAVEVSTPFEALVAQFVEAEHSRMPIYRETLDDPIGVVHVKDVFKLLAGKASKRPAADDAVLKRLRRLRRPVLYVPASMRGADLLLRMRTSRTHLALVIDEFGGVDGLVTLEDLVEAVVGEIDDEHDEAQVSGVVARPGGVFEAHARAPLDELQAALGGVDLAPSDLEEDIDTVGGLVTAVAGRVPQRGEVIAHPAGFELEVTDADPRRVKRVRVRPAAPAAEPTSA
jgi:CBS domain containing-hemolysin-like protein